MASLRAAHVALWSAALLLGAGGLAAAQPEEAPCPSGGEANFTAADCPNGSCYAGEPNGCGSRSVRVIAAEIVPERWPVGVDFTEACNAHDTCYFTLGSDKAQCDQAFLDALLAECGRAVRCIDIPILGQQCSEGNPLLEACARLAQVYYGAVNSLGQDSFARDQADQEQHVRLCQEAAAGEAP